MLLKMNKYSHDDEELPVQVFSLYIFILTCQKIINFRNNPNYHMIVETSNSGGRNFQHPSWNVKFLLQASMSIIIAQSTGK